MLTNFEILYFLLDTTIRTNKAIPNKIPKTIIFIDSIGKVDKAANFLYEMLLYQNTQILLALE
jgi:hypothetical protein